MNIKIRNYVLIYLIPITLFALLLYLKFYSDGGIILGGEGNFIIDFELHKKVYGSIWFDIGYGWPNIIPNAVGVNHFILNSVSEITKNYRVVNYVLVLCLFIMPYIAMASLIAAMQMKVSEVILISVIYVINPFTISYLQGFNQWNNFSITLLPLILLVYLKIEKPIYIIIVIGIITRLLSFSLYNPPTAAIVIFVILIGPMLILKEINKKIILKSASGIIGFALFNIDWLSVLIYSIFNGVTDQIISKEFSLNWVSVVSSAGLGGIFEVISLNSLQNKNGNNYSYYSSTFMTIANISAYSAIVLIAIYTNNKLRMISALILLVTWLAKGVAYPFGELYYFLLEKMPFFYIFKTPTEKFGILLVFLLILALANIIKYFERTYKSIFIYRAILLFYLIIYIFPIINSDALASSYRVDKRNVSRKIILNDDKLLAIKYLNENLNNSIVMTYPGNGNYQSMIKEGENYYTGLDPVLNNSNIRYIYPELDKELYSKPINKEYKDELKKRGIRGIVYNSNEEYWFGSAYDGKRESVLFELNPLFGEPILFGGYHIWIIR